VSLRSRLARINFVVLAFASVLVTACIALTSAWLAVQRQVDRPICASISCAKGSRRPW
jgi:hypothetical protein